ncbi:MAG: SRPBCC family protein [Planctomycetota bacterium]
MTSDDTIDWRVEPRVERAETLDVRLHFEAAAHARALERVFVPSWQLLPVPAPAHRVEPFTLLEDGLDEPLVLVRGKNDEERVLSNVCTHRGALVADGPSDARGLRCRYHGRRFDLDGSFVSCPGFEGAEAFPRPDDGLARLALHRVGPLRFTSIAPKLEFDEWAAPLRAALKEYDGLELTFDPSGTQLYDVDAGWAVYCENYLEGFHIPYVHPGLNAGLDFARYSTELEPFAVRQLGRASGDEARLRGGEDLVAEYLWLYPNLMVNVYAWGISVNVVEPAGVGRARIRYLRWVARPELVETGVGSGLDAVEHEDQEVVVSVQRGVRSRLYPGGRFSPEHETGPHHFQRLLAADLG